MSTETFFILFWPLIYFHTGAVFGTSTLEFIRTKPGTKEHVEAGCTLYLSSAASVLLLFVLVCVSFIN